MARESGNICCIWKAGGPACHTGQAGGPHWEWMTHMLNTCYKLSISYTATQHLTQQTLCLGYLDSGDGTKHGKNHTQPFYHLFALAFYMYSEDLLQQMTLLGSHLRSPIIGKRVKSHFSMHVTKCCLILLWSTITVQGLKPVPHQLQTTGLTAYTSAHYIQHSLKCTLLNSRRLMARICDGADCGVLAIAYALDIC